MHDYTSAQANPVLDRLRAEWSISMLRLVLFAEGMWISSPNGDPCIVLEWREKKTVVPLTKLNVFEVCMQ